jgi:hypothetical protein
MIAWYLIVAAAALTGGGVYLTAARVRWPPLEAFVAAGLSGALIVAWRIAANLYGLNEDFGPLVSVGDSGCLVAGALGPALVAMVRRALPSRWIVVLVGGVVGFVVNVVIL